MVGLVLAIASPSVAWAAIQEKENDSHDYPTQIRVRYVMECMKRNGGMNFGNLYKCSCTIDKIAEQLTVSEFTFAETYLRGAEAGGERGELLREGPGSEDARSQLLQAESNAVKECFPDGGNMDRGSGGK
ncbi:hypothetical protein [Thiohalorhabdus methylotrophus]|uniref:Uncharacterized protein n=1 Tax=Thiohalorhabdus methylotrophus TaxID=3242694 RepID=A0ABV4TWV1_9GAMM